MRLWTAAAALILMAGCTADRGDGRPDPPAQTASNQVTDASEPSSETFALGNHINPDGTLPAESAGEEFRRGGELFLSVNVTGASAEQQIAVEWRDARDRVIRKETKAVTRGTKHAAFSSGDTQSWAPGQHRAIVVINGRRVIEKPFVIL